MYVAERYHDISCGHRVYGHESKCAHLHGHNYRIHFKCVPGKVEAPQLQEDWMIEAPLVNSGLDSVGRVIDFSVIKEKLCMWVENNWDHKMLIWEKDPAAFELCDIDPDGVVLVSFNPTAENMAQYLVDVVGPEALNGTGVVLRAVRIEETAKCSASYIGA